jgi:DNA-binding transcriptional MerR regulator
MDMSGETMTIREMTDHFKVTPRTLRFYESKELLWPLRSGHHRLYTKREQARLKLILRGKKFGFSLEDIRQLLDLYDIGDQQHTQFRQTYKLAHQRLEIMELQRRELDETILELKQQLAQARTHPAYNRPATALRSD